MNFRQIKSWQWALLVIVLLVALDWAIRRPDARTRQLNAIIATQASQKLRDYPYQFQVLRVEGSTAVMSTPRNFDSPAFIAVEHLLGQVQDEAKDIVLAQPGITGIRWELDKGWLRRQGLEVPDR